MDNLLKYKVCMELLDLYCLYREEWVIMDPEEGIDWKHEKFGENEIIDHIEGKYAICVLAGEHATKFLTVDVDLLDPNIVHKVVDTMVELGIPRENIYVSFSGGKGYHVDIFFRNYVYNDINEKFYWAMIERSGLDPKKVEFRPKHTQAIKLPLGIHAKTRNRCWFVDPETLKPIKSFDPIFHIEKIDQDYFNQLVKNIVNDHVREAYNAIEESKKQKKQNKTKVSYDSLMVTEIGTRHNIQAKVAGRARMDGLDYDEIVRAQMDWYAQQDKSKISSTEDQVRLEAEELAAWAVKNVHIRPTDKAQHAAMQMTNITVPKKFIPYILRGKTEAGRLVMFLLCIFSIKYGDVKMSMKTIAEYTGLAQISVSQIISMLSSEKLITKTNTTSKYSKIVTLRGVNIYKVPGEKKLYAPETKYLNTDHYDIIGAITKDNLREMYYKTMATICKPEYLAKFMKKPELAKCMQYKEGVTADGDAGAAADA